MAFSHVALSPLARHAFLAVAFFFVLSGFVITASYGQRLRQGFSVVRFLMLRLGRIYPLHIISALPFIMLFLIKSGFGRQFWEALISNIFLLHGLGLYWISPQIIGGLNYPSWSISAEFFAYLTFTLVAVVPYAIFRLGVVLTCLLCPLAIVTFSPDLMNTTFDFGILRCLYGFSIGILCFELHSRFDWTSLVRRTALRTAVELATVVLVLSAMASLDQTNWLTVLMPLAFASLVLVFAPESGRVSPILMARPWQAIGAWSYSIYMTHALVQIVMRAAGFALQHFTHRSLFTPMRIGPKIEDLLGTTLWQGDVAVVMMVASTLALSALTHRFIEAPGRLWSRGIASRPWSIQRVDVEPVVSREGPRL